MVTRPALIICLLTSTALSLAVANSASAQATSTLQEVVVTATRQTSTVNKVPLSIAAETQQTLDEKGIRTIADLQRIAPSLSVSGGFAGVQNFAIRGIGSTQGAATTGVYLDDVAIQKRFPSGPVGTTTASGSPAPPLFDMERVEVLRGPQGTLYGGSSEGGTIRFITPTPSLTTMSGMARTDVSTVVDGGISGEAGLAIGGPIVQDKLGFRVSILDRYTAGYIDVVNPYQNGATVAKDANSTQTMSGRAALLWAPTDRLKITAAIFASQVKDNGGPNQWTLPISGTFTTPASCYNTTRQFGQSPGPTAAVACPANAVPGQIINGIYERAAQNYGPFPYLGRDKVLGIALDPTQTTLAVANITLDYDFGWVMAKSITAYLNDRTNSNNGVGAVPTLANAQTTTAFPTATGFPLFAANPTQAGSIITYNRREGITEELRFSSAPNEGRLSWIGGFYFSHIHNEINYVLPYNITTDQTYPLYGITDVQRYGVPQIGYPNQRYQSQDDNEEAAFGEATYKITSKLSAIAGLRASRVNFTYYGVMTGAANGYNTPTLANLGIVQGNVTVTPVTPKFSLEYQFTPTKIVYASAAEGFRAGGVNTPLTASLCNPALAAAGLTVNDIPTTYGSDTVWSYEVGGKFRLFNGRVQVNSSIYDIDWKNVQLTVSGLAGCPNSYVQNAGQATSRGFDFDGQAKLFGGLSTSLAVGFTDAFYAQTTRIPAPAGVLGAPVVRQGDRFPVPAWQSDFGLRYDFSLWSRYGSYLRGDFLYQGSYLRSPGPGVTQFTPDTYQAAATRQVNMRAGADFKAWDVSIYVNNLFDSEDILSKGGYGSLTAGGRSGCAIAQGAACTTFTSYNPFITAGTLRPREVGVQANYRF